MAGNIRRSGLILNNVGHRRTRFGRFEFESDFKKGERKELGSNIIEKLMTGKSGERYAGRLF